MRHTALELGNGTNILTLLAAKADASSVYTKTQVDGLIAGVAEGSTAAKVVNTIAERDALDPKRGFVWVVDATGDSTVVTGGAMYLYNEATSSWIKTAEAESMDLIVKWDDIQGKPEDITRAGNTFNTAGNLVKLGVDGKYPGIDGSLITNLSSANLNGQIGIGLIPISTNIATDAASDAKVATPKAVKTYVDDNTHTHSNKTTLDKIGEADGKMTFDGEEVGGIDPNFLSKTVWRYPATVDAESGVVTITDGTLVTEIRIGDEIVTSSGVYKKVNDSITTGSPPDGSRIRVSGVTTPANLNGIYIRQNEDKWKHETENFWIVRLTSGSNWSWCISAMEKPLQIGNTLYYTPNHPAENPWEEETWIRNMGSGSPVLENVGSSETVTDTIDLFEHASVAVASADIVQSVNGNKPDASGNVTLEIESIDFSNYSAETIKLTGTKKIQIAGGSVTSGILDITTGDDGRPALTTPGLWSADIAGYLTTIHGGMQMDIYADSSQADIRIIAGANNNSTGSAGGHILLYGADIKYNDASLNAANGLVKLGSDGKIPTNLYDAGTEIDLSNYTTTSAISMKSNGLNTGITFGTVNGEIQIYYGTLTNGLIINGGTANLRHTAAVNIIGNSSTSVGSFSGGTTTIVASNLTNLKLQIGSTSAGANTAGGFAVVESSGKLPTSIIPASTIDLSNYSNDTISLTASGVFHIRGNTLNIGTASTSEIQIGNNNSTTYLNASAEDTLYLRIGNTTAYLNAPGGLARVGLDGKLPSEIVPSNDTGYTKETIDQSKFATEDAARGTKYFEIDGLCDVLLADADGTLIGVEVQFMFATTKTRVHIPASLAAGSIASWTLLTKKITVAS